MYYEYESTMVRREERERIPASSIYREACLETDEAAPSPPPPAPLPP